MYDEDGYGAVKRVLERGDAIESVKPMATIVVNYPVTFKTISVIAGTYLSDGVLIPDNSNN